MQTHVHENTALRYSSFGDPRKVLALERVEPILRPLPALRVKMRYAPINPSDLIPVTGAYSHLIVPPMTAGYEGVGEVVSAPPHLAHMLGKRVLPLRGAGTWQRYVDCDPALAIPVPCDIPDTLAARAYINPISALHMLRSWPVTGKHVIVTGAGSAIAALLAQWAHAEGAVSISGIYRSCQRRSWLKSFGVRPLAENDSAEVQACARRADIVFDAVGGPLGSALLNGMRSGAEFVSYGLLSGQPIIPTTKNMAAHRRFHLRDILRDMGPAAWQKNFHLLWPRLRVAKMHDTQIFPIERWRDALDAFDEPGRSQKPLLKLDGITILS